MVSWLVIAMSKHVDWRRVAGSVSTYTKHPRCRNSSLPSPPPLGCTKGRRPQVQRVRGPFRPTPLSFHATNAPPAVITDRCRGAAWERVRFGGPVLENGGGRATKTTPMSSHGDDGKNRGNRVDPNPGVLPEPSAGRPVEFIKCALVAVAPSPERVAQRDAVVVALDAIESTAFPAGVTHPARADSGTGIAERPVALGGWPPRRSGRGRTWWKVAAGVVAGMLRFSGEFAAGQSDPQWSVGIGAGQGKASGDRAPARYPRMRTDRGRGVSTESRGLCCPAIMRSTYQRWRTCFSSRDCAASEARVPSRCPCRGVSAGVGASA